MTFTKSTAATDYSHSVSTIEVLTGFKLANHFQFNSTIIIYNIHKIIFVIRIFIFPSGPILCRLSWVQ